MHHNNLSLTFNFWRAFTRRLKPLLALDRMKMMVWFRRTMIWAGAWLNSYKYFFHIVPPNCHKRLNLQMPVLLHMLWLKPWPLLQPSSKAGFWLMSTMPRTIVCYLFIFLFTLSVNFCPVCNVFSWTMFALLVRFHYADGIKNLDHPNLPFFPYIHIFMWTNASLLFSGYVQMCDCHMFCKSGSI